MNGRPIATWVVCAVGVLLALLFAGLMISTGEVGSVPVTVLTVEFALGLSLPLALVGAGLWLSRSDLPPERTWQVALWTLGGLGAFTVLTAWQFYFQLLLAGGRDPSLTTLLINGQAGALSGFLVGAYDARAKRRASALSDARERLRFLNRLLRHDILNAVQVVSAHTENAAETDSIDGDVADQVLLKCEEITDLIERVRTIERAATDEDLSVQQLSMEVRNVASRAQSAHDGVTVHTDVESGLQVYGDELLSTMLDNIVSNAVEHGRTDDGSVTIDVGAHRRGDTVRITVADDGPGIADDRKESVFDLDPEGSHGVGLYLVRTIVDAYGGEVSVEDNEPTGTRFVVDLPAASSVVAGPDAS